MKTHQNICNPVDSLLIIVDVQTSLLNTMPDNDADLMLTNSAKLAHAAGLLDIPVIVTEQYPKGLGHTHNRLIKKLPDNAQRFHKTSFSCCATDEITHAITKLARKQIILVGMETHICVLQSALDLIMQGYQVYIAEDAVCSRKLEHKLYALQRMQQHGITQSCYESIIFEWLKDSTHPAFKTLSKLI